MRGVYQHSSKVEENLKRLVNKKRIKYKAPYYFLKNRGQIVDLRKKREKYSKEKIKLAKKIIKLLQFIPWIKMIGITGALAMNNSDKDDDIDLLIITGKNRLWLTRILIIAVLEILGKRRRPNDKKFKDKICLNMFLDKTALSLSKEKRNLFTSHEICQMKPIFNRGHTYERFLYKNKWVKDYLPNSIKGISEVKSSNTSEVKGKKKKLFDFLENLVYQLQLKYMKSKRTIEQVSPYFAFFHPQNMTKKVLWSHNNKLKKFLGVFALLFLKMLKYY